MHTLVPTHMQPKSLSREALEKREKLPESLARQYFRDMLKVRELTAS